VRRDQRIREADGYRLKRINEAEGDVARSAPYWRNTSRPQRFTRRRIYIETLQDVMPSVRSKIIVDERMRSILPFLNLDSQKGDSQKADSQKQIPRRQTPRRGIGHE